MEYFEEDVYRSACSRLSLRHCRSFKPQELSNTVSQVKPIVLEF